MAEAEAINKSQRVNTDSLVLNHDTTNLTDITVAIYKIFLDLFLLGKGNFLLPKAAQGSLSSIFF